MGSATQVGISLNRAYRTPAVPSATQPSSRAARKPPSDFVIGLILAFALLTSPARAEDPPTNLVKLVAERETATVAERNEYIYRQTVTVQELDTRGGARGEFKEIRDIIFS